MEFRDAWAEGDGERVLRCWKMFLPHFQAAGHTKYSLAALNMQLQTNATLSPNAAHQVMWHRFVNSKGGIGKNIPCDLYNEHVNRQVKYIIQNMGSNLIETPLQGAARSVSTLHDICQAYDTETGVLHRTIAHSSRPNTQDVMKVVGTVFQNKILTQTPGRKHSAFPKLHLDPLHKWNIDKTKSWIDFFKRQIILNIGGAHMVRMIILGMTPMLKKRVKQKTYHYVHSIIVYYNTHHNIYRTH